MRKPFERAGDGVTAVAGLLLVAACAGRPTGNGRAAPERATAAAPAAAAPAAAAPAAAAPAAVQNDAAADAPFDWHPLVVAPFGTRLVDSPIPLHEVLLFDEEPHGPSEIEPTDCYALDGVPPTFAGNPADEFLMCFEHDRLDRIDASVRLAADDAARVFGRLCALWLRNTKPLPAAEDACEGRDGDVSFSARLLAAPGERTVELLITLADAAGRDAERAPSRDPKDPPGAVP